MKEHELCQRLFITNVFLFHLICTACIELSLSIHVLFLSVHKGHLAVFHIVASPPVRLMTDVAIMAVVSNYFGVKYWGLGVLFWFIRLSGCVKNAHAVN